MVLVQIDADQYSAVRPDVVAQSREKSARRLRFQIADGGAGEIFSVPTSLPVINTAAARHDNLAVRSAPGAHFKRIAFVDKDRTVGLLGRWQEGPWVRIRTDDGTEGWVEIDALIPVSN